MPNIFKPDGPIYIFGEKLFDIVAVSILWVLCCIPIITIIPASGALYYVVVKQIRKNNGSLLQNFFGSFRDSLRIGIPLTCIVLIYSTVMFYIIWATSGNVDSGSLGAIGDYLSIAAKVLLIPLLLVLPFLVPVISRFSMSIAAILKLSIVISFRFFWRSILLLALISVSAILLWFIPHTIIALPGISALVSSFLIEPVLRKYMPETDPNDPTPWYWE